MSMVRRKFSSLILGFLFVGCAQMGTITGGPDDKTAPKVKKSTPENGTISFQANQVVIEFDEYVKLNNPSENIRLMPADAKITAKVSKKSLILDFEGELKPNTTYSLTLNRAIQDFSVGNDSLMRYVFSTGTFIDSLHLNAFVSNARTNRPQANLVAGLFADGDSTLFRKPVYFSQSDKEGNIRFAFLKEGNYQLVVFDDLNRDLLPQESESNGFYSERISLYNMQNDTLKIRVSEGNLKPKIRTKLFEGPEYIRLGATFGLDTSSVFLNGSKVENLDRWSSDSIGFFIQNSMDVQQIVVQNRLLSDTLSVRTSEKERNKVPTFRSNLKEGSLKAGDTLKLDFTGVIAQIDTAFCQVLLPDSTQIKALFWQTKPNQLAVWIPTNKEETVRVQIATKGLKFNQNKTNNPIDLSVNLKQDKSFGILFLKVKNQDKNRVLELYKEKELVRITRLYATNDSIIKWDRLEPGTYRLEGYVDENQDGIWNKGSVFKKKQPENRLFFPDEIKIRANWDIEVEPIENSTL